MRIETPTGSGNYIDIYINSAGDLAIAVKSNRLGSNEKETLCAKIHGLGKGNRNTQAQNRLYEALLPIALSFPPTED